MKKNATTILLILATLAVAILLFCLYGCAAKCQTRPLPPPPPPPSPAATQQTKLDERLRDLNKELQRTQQDIRVMQQAFQDRPEPKPQP